MAHYQPDQFLSVANRQRNETPSAELTTAFPTLLKIRRPLKACGFKSLSGHSFVSQRVGVDEVEIGLIELRLGWVGGLAFWLAHWVLDSPTGKSGPVPMGQISPQKRNGVVVGYSVYLGVDENGRRVRRFFAERLHGERFLAERNATPIPIGELWDRKAEILYNLERLRPMGTSLTDAVTFYLSNNGSSLGQKKLSELVDDFLREKLQVGRSQHYDRTMRQCFGRFAKLVGGDGRIGDISREIISDYVYRTNKHVSSTTKRNILRNLSVLFNFGVRRDLLKLNPVEKIDRPTLLFKKPHVLSPSDFEKLLRTCVEKRWDDRLVVFVLVGFCGIRVEEASRLRWSNLQLDKRIVEVPATVAKKASFRNNVIPPNAMEWLRLVEDKRRTGLIVGTKWRTQLRAAVQLSKIDYQQNCIRHSFCSYAIAAGWSLADVIAYMGHGGSSAMIYSHYRNVVSPEDGKRWFAIVPEVQTTGPGHGRGRVTRIVVPWSGRGQDRVPTANFDRWSSTYLV